MIGRTPADKANGFTAALTPVLTAGDINLDLIRQLERSLVCAVQLNDSALTYPGAEDPPPTVPIRPGCLVRITSDTGADQYRYPVQLGQSIYRVVKVRPGSRPSAVIIPIKSDAVEPDMICVHVADLQAVVPWRRKGKF